MRHAVYHPCWSCATWKENKSTTEKKRVNDSFYAWSTSLTIHKIGRIDQILSSRSIVISQNLIVNEGQTKGVGNDHDHAEGLLAVRWFGNICLSSVH